MFGSCLVYVGFYVGYVELSNRKVKVLRYCDRTVHLGQGAVEDPPKKLGRQ